jgi:DNA-binding response OmpR family regulator
LNKDALSESLQGKRIGLVACKAIEASITSALKQAQTQFTIIQADAVDLGAAELDRFDALILGVDDNAAESGWLRPEVLRNHTRPLLLAGPPEAVYCREALQSHADDVILSPFSARELLFRLHRITGGRCASRQTVVRSGKPIVLAADDDRNITIYLGCVLKNLDVEMHFVSDGGAALAAARQLLPDLLLLDIGMPIMNGLEVLRRLRNDPATRDLATVLLTASSDPSHVSDGADLGVLDYILKPFGHIDLARKLKALIRINSPLPQARVTT